MFSLRLNAKACISCGICMDVCAPGAIAMRTVSSRRVEGSALSYLLLDTDSNHETSIAAMGTFPYMLASTVCNGCGHCVAECPADALELYQICPN